MRKMLPAALLPIILAACAGQAPTRGAAAGSPFTQALAAEYRTFAATEGNQADWADQAFFRRKAEMAAAGRVPAPEDPARRAVGTGVPLNPDIDVGRAQRAEAIDGRRRLLSAFEAGATQRNPAAAARAQVAYDCWVEQLEEGWQVADIQRCRQAFQAGLAEIEARPTAAAAPPAAGPEVAATQVFFGFDSAELSPAGRQRLAVIAGDIRRDNPQRIAIVGHADKAGTEAYNRQLSQDRAQAVRDALVAQGIPAGKLAIEARGEADPLVATADEVRHPENRRVEIDYD